jgi:hypothetical protein
VSNLDQEPLLVVNIQTYIFPLNRKKPH